MLHANQSGGAIQSKRQLPFLLQGFFLFQNICILGSGGSLIKKGSNSTTDTGAGQRLRKPLTSSSNFLLSWLTELEAGA